MDVTVIAPATQTSITKELVKDSKRIVHDLEDDLIDFWIKVADAYVETATNTSLMRQTRRMNISRVLPVVQIPYPPLHQITTFKYTIDGKTEVTVDPALDTKSRTVFMLPTYTVNAITKEWGGSMTIEYEAGYDDPNKVPVQLRQASLLLATHYLSSREAAYLDPKAILIERKIAYGVDQLLAQFVIPNTNETINGGF